MPSGKEREDCSLVKEVCLRQGVAVDRTRRPKVKAAPVKADSAKTTSQVSLKQSKYSQRVPLSILGGNSAFSYVN